jgi:hypothetical protein
MWSCVLGKLAELTMYGTASASKHSLLLEYGAFPIDYKTQDLSRSSGSRNRRAWISCSIRSAAIPSNAGSGCSGPAASWWA